MALNTRRFMRLSLFVAFIFGRGGMGQDTGNFEDLTLEIGTTVQKVLPMEPLPFTVTLSNSTEAPITAHAQIDPGCGILKIYVAEANKEFEQFHSADRPSLTGIRGKDVLKPGFHTSFNGYLFYAHPANLDKDNRGQYLFESPGIYRIKATFQDINGESKIESNILTVHAGQPSGQDAAAYKFLKNLQDSEDNEVYYGNFLLRDFAWQQVLDKQEEFISRFPKSRYARYAYYSLGLTYRGRDSEKDAGRGIRLLEKAAGYEDFFLAKEALLKLIESFEDREETRKAWKYKKILARRFPDSDEGRDYVEEVYVARLERRRLVWPSVLIAIAAGVFLLALLGWLKKRAQQSQ